MAKELRLFIAVDMSNEIKRELNNSLKVLKENTVSGRFSYAEGAHVTLAFIGNIDDSVVDTLIEIINKCFDKKFDITIGGYGSFKRSYGDIVFRKPTFPEFFIEQVNNLKNMIKEKGIQMDEKPFNPHITLSRNTFFKEGVNVEDLPYNELSCSISQVILFDSLVKDDGEKYTALYKKDLK